MRLAPLALAVGLTGCSLDFVDNGDEAPPDPPEPRCELASPRYHMAQSDCGLLPPDAPPAACWWTIDFSTSELVYCWSDVCETVTYACRGTSISGRNDNRAFVGMVLRNGNLYWDGGGYGGGEYTRY